MKRKITKIGKKAGLNEKDVNSLTKVGIFGLLAAALTAFTGYSSASAANEGQTPKIVHEQRSKSKRCGLIPEKGDREGNFTTYYYNPETHECEAVRGCVTSVFETKEECEKECVNPEKPAGEDNPTLPEAIPFPSDENCGPYPGYPCGTKYSTVSINDFRNT